MNVEVEEDDEKEGRFVFYARRRKNKLRDEISRVYACARVTVYS